MNKAFKAARRRFLIAGAMIFFIAGGAFAAVPTFVTNKDNEVGELIQTILNNDWLKNVVYNLQDLQALSDLGNMASQIQEVMSNFDIQGIIGQVSGGLSGDLMKSIQDKLQGLDMGGFGNLGDILKGGLGDIKGQLGELSNINLGDILSSKGPQTAARETTERMRGASSDGRKGDYRAYEGSRSGGCRKRCERGVRLHVHKHHVKAPGWNQGEPGLFKGRR